MPRLIWTPPALLDLQRLYRFLADKNPDAAKRAVKAIRDGGRVLARQPGVGRPVQDMPTQYREWMIDFGDSGMWRCIATLRGLTWWRFWPSATSLKLAVGDTACTSDA